MFFTQIFPMAGDEPTSSRMHWYLMQKVTAPFLIFLLLICFLVGGMIGKIIVFNSANLWRLILSTFL